MGIREELRKPAIDLSGREVEVDRKRLIAGWILGGVLIAVSYPVMRLVPPVIGLITLTVGMVVVMTVVVLVRGIQGER